MPFCVSRTSRPVTSWNSRRVVRFASRRCTASRRGRRSGRRSRARRRRPRDERRDRVAADAGRRRRSRARRRRDREHGRCRRGRPSPCRCAPAAGRARAGVCGERVELLGDGGARAVVDEHEPADVLEHRRDERALGNVVVGRHHGDERGVLVERLRGVTAAPAAARDRTAIATSSALAAPSAVPARTSSGKCAPNMTRVNATAAR